jgi:hypothetical protein
MAIIATAESNTNFKPVPEGTYQGVCVDVFDMGMVESTFEGKTSMKHKIRIYWQLEELNADNENRPFLVTKSYNLTLNEKATLRKQLEAWRGRVFTDDELKGFDVESLIGINCMMTIVHETKGDKTYANIAGIMKVHKSMPQLSAVDYIRKIDRTDDKGKAPVNDAPHPAHQSSQPVLSDDDIPF